MKDRQRRLLASSRACIARDFLCKSYSSHAGRPTAPVYSQFSCKAQCPFATQASSCFPNPAWVAFLA
jgi:hypothetical protein